MLASQDNAKQSKRSTTQEQVKKITPGCYTLSFFLDSIFMIDLNNVNAELYMIVLTTLCD